MSENKRRVIAYRRKREGKTNYSNRLKLLKSRKARLVVRKSLTNITAQLIQYNPTGDVVLAHASTSELKKFGWVFEGKNTPSAYLLGLLIAKKCKDKGVSEAILDIGMQRSIAKSKIYAVAKGASDNGLKIPVEEEVIPAADRLNGKHIVDHAKKLGDNVSKVFSKYTKNNADLTKVPNLVDEIKKKLIG